MNYFIKQLILDEEKFKQYKLENPNTNDKILSNLSKLNIFVGTNNSGKSRFLRNIFSSSTLNFLPTGINLDAINRLIANLKIEVKSIMDKYRVLDYDNINGYISSITEIQSVHENKNYFEHLFNGIIKLTSTTEGRPFTLSSYSAYGQNTQLISEDLRKVGTHYSSIIKDITEHGHETSYDFTKVYIPTLRGLRHLTEDKQDVFSSRTLKDYFNVNEVNQKLNDSIFTGLNLYDETKKLLLGTLTKREFVRNFEKFLGENFFNGQDISLIPAFDSDVLYVKIGDEQERPIYDLGDGIQSIIILTFPLFAFQDKNLLVFIEEPELYLHPGLQRKLLETLLRPEFKNNQYFITTHSNHLLDMSLEMQYTSIYSFRKHLDETDTSREKSPSFYVENVDNEDNSLLEMLGVKNSSVFLSNCTIWVEGITDRWYIRHYFNIYQQSLKNNQKFKEDIHYSFIEYSGGNITHWSFLDDEDIHDTVFKSMNTDKICSKLFLISDKDSEKKLPRQKKLKLKLGNRYYCLKCKEVENLIRKEVLLKVISEYEKEDTLEFKDNNFTYKDYKDNYLGKFIEDNIKDKKRRGKYCSDSGTISDKVNFAKKVIGNTTSLNDLSNETISLCKKIYEFIMDNNK